MKGYHHHHRDMTIGSVFKTNYCGDLEIVNYKSALDVSVKFLTTGSVVEGVSASRIRRGSVSDPLHPYIAGLGYMGIGPYDSKTHKEAYQRWWGIFYRIFLSKDPNNISSYGNCSVDERWCNFQSFAKWYYSQPINPDEIYDIDKDLIMSGNRVYGPDTCLMIPESLNVLMSSDKPNPLAQGVSRIGTKFRVRATLDGVRREIGMYENLGEASRAYRRARSEAIINRATGLFEQGKLNENVLSIVKNRYNL